MGAPSDPSQTGPDLADLWPSLSGVLGSPSPQLWAWALEQYGQQHSGAPSTSPGDGTSDWPGGAPPNQVWADAVQNVGRTPAIGAQDGTNQAPAADPSVAPAATAMAAADAPDLAGTPAAEASQMDSGPDSPPGPEDGPVPASAVAAPAAAMVPINPAPPGGQAPSQASALNSGGQFLRPELSAGPDPLVAALAGEHPNNNPFGFIVDPKTGSVARPSFGGDPLNPGQATLTPVSPQDKQSYLEWLTGARANYPLGQVSPEEAWDRQALAPGRSPIGQAPVPAEKLPEPDPQDKALLNRISLPESGGDYDAVYGYGRYGRPDMPISQMTVGQVLQFQERMKAAQRAAAVPGGKISTPVGKYQITRETLDDYLKKGLVSEDTPFTPDVQDRLGLRRMNQAGLSDYRNGKISEGEFHGKMAKAWTSIEKPSSSNAAAISPGKTSWAQIMAIVGPPVTPAQ